MKKLNIFLILFVTVSQLFAGGGRNTLEIANDLYSRLAYTKAANYYINYLEKDSTNLEAWSRLASCYDKVNDYDNLSATLKTIVTRVAPNDSEAILNYAEVLQIQGDYENALVYYNKFNAKKPSDRRVVNQIAAIEGYESNVGGIEQYEIENMIFNTDAFEYAPNIFHETLLYTSTSANDNASTKTHNWTGASYSDIQKHPIKEGDAIANLIHSERLNTPYNDGPFTIDPTTGEFYYTRNNYDPEKAFNKKGLTSNNYMNLKIYIADGGLKEGGKFKEFAHNSEEFNIGHPAISPDGKYLVFVSDDTTDNVGGRDLYYSSRDGIGEWGMPKLLNSSINTEGDELFPHFHQDGTLYFSSDGLGSLGGLDIFKAEVDFENNTASNVERLPEGMNSTYDDFGIIFKNENEGYFTSDRIEGFGKDDIYHFVDNSILLNVIVVNAKTDSILPGSDLKVSLGSDEIYNGVTDDSATYTTRVLRNQIYDLWADEDYYVENTNTASTKVSNRKKEVTVKVKLAPIEYMVRVLDAKTNQPINNAHVNVAYLCNQTSDEFATNYKGTHALETHKDCNYEFIANANGYKEGTLEWKSSNEDKSEVVTIYLEEGFEELVLRNIYYDFDKWDLRLNESFEDLEKVYNFLIENPTLIVEIGSHTDARATHKYNISLSQRRAQSVVDFLVARGIEKSRIIPVGYGETQVINECVDNVKCSEEDHQYNRRTVLRVVDSTDKSVKIESTKRQDIEIDPCKGCPF